MFTTDIPTLRSPTTPFIAIMTIIPTPSYLNFFQTMFTTDIPTLRYPTTPFIAIMTIIPTPSYLNVLHGYGGRAEYPWAWLLHAWHGWHTSWCPQRDQHGSAQQPKWHFAFYCCIGYVIQIKNEHYVRVKTSYLLQSHHSCWLKTKILPEFLGNLTHKTTKGSLLEEQVGWLLVPTDLTKGNGSWTITMGLLDTSGGRDSLTSGLGGEILTGGFASGGLTGGLFGASHGERCNDWAVSVRRSVVACVCCVAVCCVWTVRLAAVQSVFSW